MQITVNVDENVRPMLARILPRAIAAAVRAVAIEAHAQVKAALTGRILKVRSGKLRGSWGGAPRFRGSGMNTVATLSSSSVYAAIHEFGETIRPKQARHLWIPLPTMLTGAGVSRGTPRQVLSNPGAFGFTGTFKRGSTVFGKRGKSGQAVPIFALKDQVDIPARRYITRALQAAASRAQQVVEAAVNRAVAGTGGDA